MGSEPSLPAILNMPIIYLIIHVSWFSSVKLFLLFLLTKILQELFFSQVSFYSTRNSFFNTCLTFILNISLENILLSLMIRNCILNKFEIGMNLY